MLYIRSCFDMKNVVLLLFFAVFSALFSRKTRTLRQLGLLEQRLESWKSVSEKIGSI